MSDRKVDYDRGALIMNHPGSGMDVFMYVDTPGKYFDANLNAVPDVLAGEAGYKIEHLTKERIRMERKAHAAQLIDNELFDDDDIKDVLVEARNDFELVSIGLGRHNVKDPDGNVLNAYPLPKEGAQKLLYAMAGEVSEPERIEAKGGKNK